MVLCVIFAYFGGGISPKRGQSTIVIENYLKIFISIKMDVLIPNLQIILSNYKKGKRYGDF